MFADVAKRILSDAVAAPDGGFDAPLWASIEEAGLDRVLLPESLDGAGDAFEDAAAIMVAFGRAGAWLPLGETIAANWCLAHAGLDVPPGPKALLLEPELRRPRLSPDGRLCWEGTGSAVWMPAVPFTVVAAPGEDGQMTIASLRNKSPGAVGETVTGEPVSVLSAEGQGLATDQAGKLGRDAQLPLAIIALLQSAALAGALDRACEMTIEYANVRKQFGRSISRFQAVQHMAARMASESAAAMAAVRSGADRLSGANALWAVAVAKSRASEAAGRVAADAHQIHGAIGFTREYELHRHTRRLWAWRERYGNERYWNERIGRAAIACDGEQLWPDLVSGMEL